MKDRITLRYGAGVLGYINFDFVDADKGIISAVYFEGFDAEVKRWIAYGLKHNIFKGQLNQFFAAKTSPSGSFSCPCRSRFSW